MSNPHRWTDENAHATTEAELPRPVSTLMVIALIAVLILLFVGIANICKAEAPRNMPHPEWHAWFESQHNLRGGSCCGLGDGHLVDDRDWGTTESGQYWVRIDGAKHVVEHWQNMRPGEDNPTGSAIVWYARLYDGSLTIYCFAPGTMY